MAVYFGFRVYACAKCDICGDPGPIAMVPFEHDLNDGVVQLNSGRRSDYGVIGPGGEWTCSTCKTPAVEPRR